MIQKIIGWCAGIAYAAVTSVVTSHNPRDRDHAGSRVETPAISADQLAHILRVNSESIVAGIRAGLGTDRPIIEATPEQIEHALRPTLPSTPEDTPATDAWTPPHEHDDWMDGQDPLDMPDIYHRMTQEFREQHGE